LRVNTLAKRANNRVWTDEDTERLRRHIEQGGSVARASVIFRRSEQAVRSHAAANGWKFPTIRELRKRASGSERFVPPQL
jgi:hypothetical protein